MSIKKYGSLAFLLLGCLCMLLLSTFFVAGSAHAASSPVSSPSAVTTSCPAPGTGRAAVMPALTLGNHQIEVYVSTRYDSSNHVILSALERYDVSTQRTTTLLSLANKGMQDAQISADGQWVLFVVLASPQNKLQLIRIDGRYHQTLYCNSSISGVQWSTDKKLIVFGGGQTVMLLATSTGAVQTELTVPAPGVNVRTWLDTTRIYLTNIQQDQPPNIIYILDTKKGGSQHLSDLITVLNGSFADFDSSYNGTQLYVNSCVCGLGGIAVPARLPCNQRQVASNRRSIPRPRTRLSESAPFCQRRCFLSSITSIAAQQTMGYGRSTQTAPDWLAWIPLKAIRSSA